MPNAHVAEPTIAMIEPVMNPRRRPTRAIQSAAGIAASADPSDVAGDPKRRERLVVDQRIADQAVHRDQAGVVDQQQRLAAGEERDIAVGGSHAKDAGDADALELHSGSVATISAI